MIPLRTLKGALRLDPDSTAEDEHLELLEAAAVAYVEDETGRYYRAPAERTERVEANGQRSLWLTSDPVGDVAVTLDGAAVDAADFEVFGRELRHANYWGRSIAPVVAEVTYTAGYEPQEAPADIRFAVVQLVTHWYENRLPVAFAAAPQEIPMAAAQILRNHRRAVA